MKLNKIYAYGAGAIVAACQVMSASAFAATPGDQSTGQVVFSGYVPGFIPGDSIIITGAGGSLTGTSFNGMLNIEPNGRFSSSPIILEARDYDETSESPVGDRVDAMWVVRDINTTNSNLLNVLDDISVTDSTSGTSVTSAEIPTSPVLNVMSDSVTLILDNENEVPGDIAGDNFMVNVLIVAEAI